MPALRRPPFADAGPARAGGPPASGEVALAGADGRELARLIRQSKAEGVATLARLAGQAVRRFARAGGPPTLFTDAERQELADALAGVLATADLLGRARVRELADDALTHAGAHTLGDRAAPLRRFADSPGFRIEPPEAALDYFRGLVPEIGVDPGRFGESMRRRAFTLAESTDQVLTERVRESIARSLAEGRGSADAQHDVGQLLAAAGVDPGNPQYPEMVFRTNAMDAYQQAAYEEARHPDLRGVFPVWQYVGIADGRQGKDHEPKFDRFYPAEAAFADVRGPRPFNCRCSLRWVDAFEWDELKAKGARVETTW